VKEGIVLTESKVEEYLKQGIYGAKETNPDERRQFLGTLRERIEVALTQAQVMEEEIYKEVEQAMKNHPKLHLLLNGQIDYRFLSKYVKLADQNQMKFTIETNKEHQTDIGLVLAHEDAVDKENIYITQSMVQPELEPQQKKNKGLFSFFKKLT
jgi:uncharacterized protein YueI